jgi:hypothetical protein
MPIRTVIAPVPAMGMPVVIEVIGAVEIPIIGAGVIGVVIAGPVIITIGGAIIGTAAIIVVVIGATGQCR